MITCNQCGREVRFVAGTGWSHLEPIPEEHQAVPSSRITPVVDVDPSLKEKGEEAELFMRAFTYVPLEVIGIDLVRRTEMAKLQHLFLSVYYHRPGLDWREVRNHNTNHTCHCNDCTRRCKVCA